MKTQTESRHDPVGRSALTDRVAVCAILALALLIRLWMLPPVHAPDLGDEVGYLSGGCLLLEGIPPTFKFAPAATVTWLTFFEVGLDSARRFLRPDPQVAAEPLVVRPLAALDAALFDAYADMGGLRRTVSVLIMALSLVGVWAAGRLGRTYAGTPGLVLCGGLMALSPTIASLSVQTRPYSPAWTFAILSLCTAVAGGSRRPWLLPGVFLGLAVASRIDMVLVAPLILMEMGFRRAWSGRPWWAGGTRLCGVAAATFLLVAPWYVTHLIGNLRVIATVRVLNVAKEHGFDQLTSLLWDEGLGPALLLIAVGLAVLLKKAGRQVAVRVVYLTALLVSAVLGTQFGLRHQGALLIAVVGFAPLALGALRDAWFRRWRLPATAVLVGLVLVLPLSRALELGIEWHRNWPADHAVRWIEDHVPSGTTIYLQSHFEIPLPTVASGERIWARVNAEDAWRRKLGVALSRWNLEDGSAPRVLSEEHLYQERGNRRRFFILAGSHQRDRPRFDLRLISGSPFDLGNEESWTVFEREGGALLWRGRRPTGLGEPAMSWTSPGGEGVFVYLSPGRR